MASKSVLFFTFLNYRDKNDGVSAVDEKSIVGHGINIGVIN
jgi:hypothetical protein